MSEQRETCPKCGESIRERYGIHDYYQCSSEGWDGIVTMQSTTCRIRELESTVAKLQADIVGLKISLNLVAGVATNLMVAVGMDWNTEVASLCNFSEPEKTREKWRLTSHKAHDLVSAIKTELSALRRSHAAAIEAAVREI